MNLPKICIKNNKKPSRIPVTDRLGLYLISRNKEDKVASQEFGVTVFAQLRQNKSFLKEILKYA